MLFIRTPLWAEQSQAVVQQCKHVPQQGCPRPGRAACRRSTAFSPRHREKEEAAAGTGCGNHPGGVAHAGEPARAGEPAPGEGRRCPAQADSTHAAGARSGAPTAAWRGAAAPPARDCTTGLGWQWKRWSQISSRGKRSGRGMGPADGRLLAEPGRARGR